jgi:hypothetical protein
MAPLMRPLLTGVSLIVLVLTAVGAQDRATDPVPTWPEDGRIPPQYRDRYVFLTQDKHTVVVLAPENAERGMAGPKQTVRVALWNDIRPMIDASMTSVSLGIKYEYAIANAKDARDPIGKFTLIVPASVSDLNIRHIPINGAPWAGASAYAGAGANFAIAQQVILQKPPGRYLTWFYQRGNVIPPGAMLDGFIVESSYLPGLTTAWFSSGRLVEFDQSWPAEIFQQLEFFEDRRFREASVITVGPMFPPETPKAVITETFRRDLEQLNKFQSIDVGFAQAALRALDDVRRNPSAEHVLQSVPNTSSERAITSALGISLGITVRSPQ